MAQLGPGAKLLVLPDGGHFAIWQNLDVFNGGGAGFPWPKLSPRSGGESKGGSLAALAARSQATRVALAGHQCGLPFDGASAVMAARARRSAQRGSGRCR